MFAKKHLVVVHGMGVHTEYPLKDEATQAFNSRPFRKFSEDRSVAALTLTHRCLLGWSLSPAARMRKATEDRVLPCFDGVGRFRPDAITSNFHYGAANASQPG